jgi:hypothetical protein
MLDEEKVKLLGRIAFSPEPEKTIRKIISFGKKGNKAEEYIKGYNFCDGEHSLNEIAKLIGVTPGTLSPILQKWANIGIVFEVEGKGGKFYKRLFPV